MESWVHVTPISGNGNDTVSITVDKNSESTDRRSTITVKTPTISKILTIIQKKLENMKAYFIEFPSSYPTVNDVVSVYSSSGTLTFSDFLYSVMEAKLAQEPIFICTSVGEDTMTTPVCIETDSNDSETTHYLFFDYGERNQQGIIISRGSYMVGVTAEGIIKSVNH